MRSAEALENRVSPVSKRRANLLIFVTSMTRSGSSLSDAHEKAISAYMKIRPELEGEDPVPLFQSWLKLAESSEPNDPTATALATCTRAGIPSVRMVLVKGVDATGFTFFTNAYSQKGRELAENPHAALCFHWKSLRRQVRVTGVVTGQPEEAIDRYFHSRSRRSQIGAAVSQQSRPLGSREELEDKVKVFEAEHQGEIPRPPFWCGYLLKPESVEFWIDGPDRLHDRLLFTRDDAGWGRVLLYP